MKPSKASKPTAAQARVQRRQVKRLEANRVLLGYLGKLIERHPELRFNQLLIDYGFITEGDDYERESDSTLDEVEHSLNRMQVGI